MTWMPHPGPQTEFCARGEFETLYGGAAGPGKTDCLIAVAARRLDHPKYRSVIFRRTFPQLQEIIDRCYQRFPNAGGVYRSTEHRWYFPSGATIQLAHMQHENDKYNWQGKEFHFVGFDELTQFSEGQYLYLFSRARSTEPELPPRVRSTTNPGGPGHLWVKERFVDVGTPGSTHTDPATGLTRAFIPGKISDNPSLAENDPGYLSRLEALPEIERKRLVDGDWEVFEGQVFPELSNRVHGVDPFAIPPEWERFMVMDWGYSKPFSVGWYAVDYDGVLYRYREYYGCKDGEADVGLRMSASEVANEILGMEQGEDIRMRVADPAIFSKLPGRRTNEAMGISVANDFQSAGLFFIKADNNRLQGKMQVHQRLRLDTDFDPETGEILNEYPTVMVFRDQSHFWRTMASLQADPRNNEDVDTAAEDHIYDEFRYACMYRPMRPKVRQRDAVGTFQHERQRLIRARKLARVRGISVDAAYRQVR